MVDMGDDAEVTDAGDVGHLRRALAGSSAAVRRPRALRMITASILELVTTFPRL
jgi:hypothetical protein